MAVSRLVFSGRPTKDVMIPAFEVIVSGVASINSFVDLYNNSRRGKEGGRPTDAEQDLLRAMLVMSGATLDSVLKKMIVHGFHDAVRKIPGVRDKAADLVQKQLLQGNALGRILFAESSFDVLVEMVVRELTGSSLQSVEELFKVGSFLGLDVQVILSKQNQAELKGAFEVRNQIIHELDVAPMKKGQKRTAGHGVRRLRAQDDMAKHSRVLLEIAEQFLTQMDLAL